MHPLCCERISEIQKTWTATSLVGILRNTSMTPPHGCIRSGRKRELCLLVPCHTLREATKEKVLYVPDPSRAVAGRRNKTSRSNTHVVSFRSWRRQSQ